MDLRHHLTSVGPGGGEDVGALAGVTLAAVTRFETDKGGLRHSSAEALRKELEGEGVRFHEDRNVAAGPGVALKPDSAD